MAGGRAPCLALAALLLVSLPVGAVDRPTDTAQVAIDSCVKRLNPETDIGYERVAARCPDLTRLLEEGSSSAWLPRDWKRPGNDLTVGGLRELGRLLAQQERDSLASDGRSHQLNVADLPAVLSPLARGGAAERKGWWAQTKAWLRNVLERGEEEDDSWFSRVVGRNGLSQAVIELVSYVALALVVVLAAVIILNEVRVGGVFGRLWRRFVTRPRVSASVGTERAGSDVCLSWDEVQKAAPVHRPRMLLELIASRLTEEGRLPQSRGLTVRELTRLARLADEADRRRFAELAQMSERMRFSESPVCDEAVGAVLEGGRLLLERL